MKQNTTIRQLLTPLKRTPFHPQWFVFRNEHKSWLDIGRQTHGLVFDIGAGVQIIQNFLPADCHYVSMDYYQTATEWYHTQPQIFGDGQHLPIKSNSVDTTLLLDVLEHLPLPEDCIAEVRRVLRPGGRFVLQVPFLYPLHDVPYDFYRWTRHGLQSLAARHGFDIDSEIVFGHPIESAALLMNLALSKTVFNWFRDKHPLLLVAPLLLFVVPGINICAWLLARLSHKDEFMPHSYRVVWTKPE